MRISRTSLTQRKEASGNEEGEDCADWKTKGSQGQPGSRGNAEETQTVGLRRRVRLCAHPVSGYKSLEVDNLPVSPQETLDGRLLSQQIVHGPYSPQVSHRSYLYKTDNTYSTMLPRTFVVCLIAVLAVAVVSAQPSEPTTVAPAVDVKAQCKELVASIRLLVTEAKEGVSLNLLHQNVLDLQNVTSNLLLQIPGEVSECQTQAIIKMAATETGSHEVLQVLMADDVLAVLSARLELSLVLTYQVAQQLESELTLSSNVTPYLAAIIFATNTTINVIETADKALKDVALPPHKSHLGPSRVRRQFRTSVDLGRGWSAGLNGLSWQSRSGNTQFNVRPTFNGLRPDGFRAGLTIRF